ncbi:hypothetical protein GOBAR_AA20842 [Gossypium barbadense]|uniref:DC1 domain-containing protein n=2 Tax=Gossypium barbadense TaxID=3634 RepID=A0A2P5X913_GOSBA|nr:hypothetical protein GOBAR_AA20842 [Gossypium barbadense]
MEKQEVEQLDAPIILAVKGQTRNTVAYKLAKHLKYPLIDQDEITPFLQNSKHLNNISFEISLSIASIQLKELKLGVIISTPLSQKTQLDNLKKQAKSAGALLVIIQCLPKDGSNDFNIEGVPRLIVDPRKQTFVAEKFVSDELDKVRKRSYRHLHPLIFKNKLIPESEVKCSRCQETIPGPYYQCFLGCDEYIFHKACGELPGDLEQVGENCPKYLRVTEPEYLFPENLRSNCKICKYKGTEFSDGCHDCLFQTNMKGGFLPIIVNHESHAHPLNLLMMPLSYNYEFRCSGCGDFGHSISYRCYDCNFNLHVSCILLPRTVSYNYDKHPLRLTYDSLEQSYLEKSYCEAFITGLITMKRRRETMEVFTPKLMKLWKDWELRAMVVTSLLVQIILIVLGSQRKYIPKVKVRAIVWCSYLLADSVATIALGILTNNLGDIYDERGDVDLNTKLTAFWAPFLLLHLGGPDTITAYALEDNQLWLRHCFGLIIQTVVTGYIFLMAWSDSRLSLLSIPMIVVGSIKYGERTWTLWKASSDELRDSMLTSPDPGPNYSKLMNEYRLKQAEGFFMEIEEVKDVQEELDVAAPQGTTPDDQNIVKAHALFQTFKCLFADLILSFKDREKSQSLFQKMSGKDAFDVVAIELGFMYDKLYTKAVVIYTPMGLIRRITTFCLTFLVLLVFSFEDMKKYKKVDIFITFLLLVVAVFLEIYAALVLLFSDQTNHWLIKHNKTSCLKLIHSLQPVRKRWSSRVPQSSLLGSFLKEKPYFRLLKRVVEKWPPETYAEVDDDLKNLIFKHVKEKFNQFKEKQDDGNFRDLCSQRGTNVLQMYKRQTRLSLEWSINVEFDQSILIWHIATELCYFSEVALSTITSEIQSSREVSYCISNYMFCLLATFPFLLPIGIGLIRFRDTQAEAKRFFKERLTLSRTKAKHRITCNKMFLQSIDGELEMQEEESNTSTCWKSLDQAMTFLEEPTMYQMTAICKMLLRENIDVLPGKVKGDSSKSVLFDACRLASALNGVTNKKVRWDMIRDIWLEMLTYAASHSRGSQHCQQLRRGGELLTHVWLLMAHFGMSEQFQISKGYARALLTAK